MKTRILRAFGLLLAALLLLGASNCDNVNEREQKQVLEQQEVYGKVQPPPFFEWSLQRQLWIDFYVAQSKSVSTFSYITSPMTGEVLFETPSQGFPLPADTQLTNPLQTAFQNRMESPVIEQPEPNGLFTSKNTDATILMAVNGDGTVSPIYTELKVTAFPFPVRMEDGKWVRVEGQEPTIKLKLTESKRSDRPELEEEH
ncbi:hypothetical protein HY375_02710 [Candidatus Berkelbacteria bacterium]|nr:hypothetical protein [Candidatus Berkelbacteria bacterium]